MRILGYERIAAFVKKHADSRAPLKTWYSAAGSAAWKSLAEVRRVYPHADAVGACTVFNIGGNKYRLVAVIDYQTQMIAISDVLTHAEYNKDKWKSRC